ncbi:OsmC/Ohr family protein [Tenacibaculum sp. 190524A02b]|uniref:OsmC family protein n=1 Tax=Tenacibaculum vairaonense TaxID=3137860 RepID=UPI0032B2EB0C
MAQHTVTTTWKENMQFESDNPSGHKITIDANAESGGNDAGLRPKALMLSSLAGCSGLDVVSLLKKMRITVDDFKMNATGELTDEHPKYYHTVTLNYHFTGTDLDEDKITKAVNLSIEKYCGVMEMFRKFATIKTNIHFHQK